MEAARHRRFAEEFVRNQNRVYRYILTLLPRRSEAEEVFQQTSLTLWETWERYDAARDFTAWACAIAHNVLRNHLRKLGNHPHVLLSEELLARLGERRLEREGDLDERRRLLSGCLDALPLPQRRLVEEVYGSGRSMTEIASGMTQTPNAVYKLLRRIRAALHTCVDRKLAAPGVSS